ncbi:MAG: RHS repeat-associated core domain-containing protein [Bdellovibrionales bacterium]
MSSPTQPNSSKKINKPYCERGSIIRTDDQSFAEQVPLTGTPFKLAYSSNRIFGRSDDRVVTIPVTGADVTSIASARVAIKVADQIFTQDFPNPAPNLNYQFEWDGRNAQGRPGGSRRANIKVIYFAADGTFESSTSMRVMSHWNSERMGIGGWTISPVHHYDFLNERLYLGDGNTRNVTAAPYGANSDGYLIAAEDGSEFYIFNSDGLHLETRHGLTKDLLYSMTYSSDDRLNSITDAFGNATVVERGPDNDIVSITAPFGQKTLFTVDGGNRVASITNPLGETYSAQYRNMGIMTSFSKPSGLTSSFETNSRGLLLKDLGAGGDFTALERLINPGTPSQVRSTSALGRAQVLTSVASGNASLLIRIDPRGLQTTTVDNPEGASKTVDPSGRSSSAEAGPDIRFANMAPIPVSSVVEILGTNLRMVAKTEQMTSIEGPIDPSSLTDFEVRTTLQENTNRVSVTNFTIADRTQRSATAEGRTSSSTLNDKGLLASSQIGELLPVSYAYTSRGQLRSVTQGDRVTSFQYNAQGHMSGTTDALGRQSNFAYDQADRMISQTRPDGQVLAMRYDANGNLIGITPPGKTEHKFSLNLFELMAEYLPPILGGTTSTNTLFDYNLDRQMTAIHRPDGRSVSMNYNAATGVLESTTGSDILNSFTYSPVTGLPTQVTSIDGVTTSIEYVGPLPSRFANSGSATGGVKFAFTPEFEIQSIQVEANGQIHSPVNLTYNRDNELVSVGIEQLARAQLTGFITSRTIGGVSGTYSHNGYGELVSEVYKFNGSDLSSFNMARDKLGRITVKDELIGGQTTRQEFTYDLSGRLSAVSRNGVLRSYTYDANGNRLSITENGSTSVNWVYDEQDRLIQAGNVSLTYNANGDLVSKTNGGNSLQLVYDSLGALKAATVVIAGSNPNDDSSSDDDSDDDDDSRSEDHRSHDRGKKGHKKKHRDHGKHKGKNKPPTNVATTKRIEYLVDGQGRRVAKKVDAVVTKQFVYQGDLQLAAELDGAGNLVKQFVYGTKPHSPDYMIFGGSTYAIISDQVGSPRLVVDIATGQIAQQIEYDEFGQILSDSSPDFQPFGFAGGLYDQDTKLVRFGARDYDPAIGRWTAKDPVRFEGSVGNLYSYSSADPVNAIDPTGLVKCNYSIGSGNLTCLSNDKITQVTILAISGYNVLQGIVSATGQKYGPIPVGTYDIRKGVGQTGRNWYLDPGPIGRLLYKFKLVRGGFNLHLGTGTASEGCLTARPNDNPGGVFTTLDLLFHRDLGENSLTVTE